MRLPALAAASLRPVRPPAGEFLREGLVDRLAHHDLDFVAQARRQRAGCAPAPAAATASRSTRSSVRSTRCITRCTSCSCEVLVIQPAPAAGCGRALRRPAACTTSVSVGTKRCGGVARLISLASCGQVMPLDGVAAVGVMLPAAARRPRGRRRPAVTTSIRRSKRSNPAGTCWPEVHQHLLVRAAGAGDSASTTGEAASTARPALPARQCGTNSSGEKVHSSCVELAQQPRPRPSPPRARRCATALRSSRQA